MSFSLWPSSYRAGLDKDGNSPFAAGNRDEQQQKQQLPLTTPALDLLAMISVIRPRVFNYRDIADVGFLSSSRFVGSGGHATVEITNLLEGECVAIKRMKPFRNNDGSPRTRFLRNLAQTTLELRILTLDGLCGHRNIVGFRGLCYEEPISAEENPIGVGQFHLMLEYSRLGSMASFLRQNVQPLSIEVKIDLVRQIGCGLSSLHSFKICHGDLKVQNVLVFEGQYGGYTAKLTDFGISVYAQRLGLYEQHEQQIHYPWGTPLMNAPEIRNQNFNAEPININAAIAAEVFSFGLLMWEVIRDGQSYFDPAWIDTDDASHLDIGAEEQIAFLSSLPQNGLLMRSEEFLSTQDFKDGPHQQILQVFQASLQDEPLQRQQIFDIVRELPSPHKTNLTMPEFCREWSIHTSLHELTGFPSWNDARSIDLLNDVLYQLPNSFQRYVVEELKICAISPSMDLSRADAALMVASSYLISFGVENDSSEILHWLKLAETYRDGPMSVRNFSLDRISEAIDHPDEVSKTTQIRLVAEPVEADQVEASGFSELYLVNEIRSIMASIVVGVQNPSNKEKIEVEIVIALQEIEFEPDGLMTALETATFLGDNEAIIRLLPTTDFCNSRELKCNAVHYACLGGNLSTLQLVLDRGALPLGRNFKKVTPLHLLIFMPRDAISTAVDLLIAGGILGDTQSEPILLTPLDLRLVGTPLEWAVIARNRMLVDALLPHSKGQERKALRLAVKYFFYEIVADLLAHQAVRDVVTFADCPMFAVERPFSHLIVHGRDGDIAIERTIRLCAEFELIDYETVLRESIEHARTQACLRSIEVLLDLCPPSAVRYGYNPMDDEIVFDETSFPTLYLAFAHAKTKVAWKNILKAMIQNFTIEELNKPKKLGNALHMAVHQSWEIAVRVLVEKGLDFRQVMNWALPVTAYDLAVRRMDVKMLAVLAEYGGSDFVPDRDLAHTSFPWWMTSQSIWTDLGFKRVFHDHFGDSDASMAVIARQMRTLLIFVLVSRDTTLRRKPLSEQDRITSERHWNTFRSFALNESVKRCIDMPDDDGVTMLQRAAAFLDIDVVKFLLEAGADADVPFLNRKVDSNNDDPVVCWLPFQIACWVGRTVSCFFESGDVAVNGETETPSPKPAGSNMKGARALHLLHWMGLAKKQAVKKCTQLMGTRKRDRIVTPGMKTAATLRAKSLQVALEILRWHQVREDRRFDGVTELHICAHIMHTERYIQLLDQGMDPDIRTSWPGREGEYTAVELTRLNYGDQRRTGNYRKLRGRHETIDIH